MRTSVSVGAPNCV
jgi:hypothetical protein